MTDEQLIAEFQKQVDEWRATGAAPRMADAAVAQLIGIIGGNRPDKPQAIAALAQVDWPLAVNFLSALTPPGMVFVPAGPFTMGSTDSSEEQPVHTVWVDSFYIDKTPVTNKQFGFFWEDVPYNESVEAWDGFEEGRTIVARQGQRRAPYHWFDEEWNPPDKPVVGVSWYEAMVCARWAGKRLPSEAEWEKAARGTDGRRYPWGNAFDATRCNTNIADNAARSTMPVGRFSPTGDSPYGAQDLAGNVWEWTASLYKPYPYAAGDGRNDPAAPGQRVLRGGGFGSYFEDHYRSAHRYPQNPDYMYVAVGFRCASTVPVAPRS
ncbi:MAG: formylglycine-generating enzyme family protein [Chloroflexi bacterium]|nr:formylglycine-generating enzyme family protein [Chloroflexota bacterium]